MKTLMLLVLALCHCALAANLTTTKGVTYQDYKVTKVEKEGIRIMHSDGTATIDFDDLPAPLQAQYGWTPQQSSSRTEARNAVSEAMKKQEEQSRVADEMARAHEKLMAENAASAERYRQEQKRQKEIKAEEEKKAEEKWQSTKTMMMVLAILFIVVLFALMPTFIAIGKPQIWPVFFLNLISLLGGFGHATEDRIMAAAVYVVCSGVWITAFVLAVKPKPQGPVQINFNVTPNAIQRQPRVIQARTLPPNAP